MVLTTYSSGIAALSKLTDDLRGNVQLSPQEIKRLDDARSNLLDFTRYTFPDYEPNWHHELLCTYLDKYVSGEITRLIVSMPPQHGKSELVTLRLPAYILGRNPDAKVMSTSYGASLSQGFNRQLQRIIDDDAYRRLFPDTQLFGKNIRTVAKGAWLRNSDILEIVNKRGVYRNSGIGGGITGKPFQYGFIDDPIKNAKEANSKVFRDSVWEWYTSTFWTRQSRGGGSIALIMTRWHMDDLAGRLIKQARDGTGEDWIILELPARMDDLETKHPEDPRQLGEALWEDSYPIEFLEMAEVQNSFVFAALYQQQPIAHGQSMFDVDKLKANTLDEIPNMNAVVRFYDLAVTQKKTSDYTAGVKMGRTADNRIIILDMYRAQKVMPETEKSIIANALADGKSVKIRLEGAKEGIVQLDYLIRRDELQGYTIDKEPPIGSKEVRAGGIATQVNNGQVYVMRGNWNQALFDELESFPLGAHDDQVDTLSGAYDMLINDIFTFEGLVTV